MKLLLVIILLFSMLFGIIIILDVFSGVSLTGIVSKALNPFRVMEPAEYVIIMLFMLFFCIEMVSSYLNKKKQNNPESN